MGFIEGELFRNVWLLVVSLIISQALMSLADEPIRCSRSVLDIEQTRPIKLSIQIYKADRLPIGESYVSGKQVVNSHAEHVANLDFSYHLKSGFKLYD